MAYEKIKEKLVKSVYAGVPIVYINSFEEQTVDEIIADVMPRLRPRKVYEWNGGSGFVRFDTKTKFGDQYKPLKDTLDFLVSTGDINQCVLVIKDSAFDLEHDPALVAKIKEVAMRIMKNVFATLVIISPTVYIPKPIEKFTTLLEVDYLESDDIKDVVRNYLVSQKISRIDEDFLKELSLSMKGLTKYEIENLLAFALTGNKRIGREDLPMIIEQKQQMIKKSGSLELIPLKETMEDIGGLENLKAWLKNKAYIYKNIPEAQAFGVSLPKGVLIAGVPGCGKSLNAKAAASLFGVPLLRLDMGRILGKYLGESEANMRNAIALAEAISPCVLWIDELEKAFAGLNSENSSEVTVRLLGSILTWMQEKDGPTFVVATANDISKLPPELLRKGRFDEIFYVGLPNEKERKAIFEIHINKRRKQDVQKIDLQKLVKKSEGYSGSDIEGVVKEGIELAFVNHKKSLSTEDILNAMNDTQPISKTMSDAIDKLKKAYEDKKFKNASET